MKAKLMMLVLMSLGVATGTISLAHAQVDETEKVNIPFDFYAGGQKMPAGNYTVNIYLEGERIMLGDDSGNTMFLMGIPEGTGSDNSELVFEHSGDTYVLKEVKSDVTDLSFSTKVPAVALESRRESPQVEVALNR